MKLWDVVIVGGGPAGSTAAWKLKRAGLDVLVLDKERFPRLKLCAGWITPDVVRDLALDPAQYPHRFLTFDRLHAHVKGLHARLACVQHSIRRFEFDAWLLERSGATFEQHTVRALRREPGGGYSIDDTYRCRYLIGAGGTRCPVYRTFFREANPRASELQTVTLEHEFEYDWQDPDCHLWFFEKGLPGYSWYVPKQNGWLNVGIGGMAERLKHRGQDIKQHWATFIERLGRRLARGAQCEPTGYSYYLRGNVEVPRVEDAFVTGDAAGLATRDMCEGIGPAVASGLRAARAILGEAEYRLSDLSAASLGGGFASRMLDWLFTRGSGRPEAPLLAAAGSDMVPTVRGSKESRT